MKIKYFGYAVILPMALFFILSLHAKAATTNEQADKNKQNSSLNWAGYVSKNGTFSGVSGTWVVPDVKNSRTYKTDAAWVGIGGATSADLIQAGTQSVTGVSGKVKYSAWYELLPNYSVNLPITIHSGDMVSVNISEIHKDNWKIVFTNNTTRKKVQKTVRYRSSNSSAEWIEEMPSNGNLDLIPLDNFKSVLFRNISTIEDGSNKNALGSGAEKIFMTNVNGKTLVAPLDLGSDGASFEVDRLGRNFNLGRLAGLGLH